MTYVITDRFLTAFFNMILDGVDHRVCTSTAFDVSTWRYFSFHFLRRRETGHKTDKAGKRYLELDLALLAVVPLWEAEVRIAHRSWQNPDTIREEFRKWGLPGMFTT